MRYIPDDNLRYPVLIELEDGSSGSGFYLNKNDEALYLVTATHVLYKKNEDGQNILRSNNVKTISYDRDLKNNNPIEARIVLNKLNPVVDAENDLVVVKVSVTKEKNPDGRMTSVSLDGFSINMRGDHSGIVVVNINRIRKYNDVLISNEVFIFGYPNSIGIQKDAQIDYRSPLLRKGVIAGKNEQKRTIILDCPVYFGNSGGLAIEVEETGLGQRDFFIIGVVSQFIPFVDQLQSLRLGYINTSIENSGYSVVAPADTLLKLMEN